MRVPSLIFPFLCAAAKQQCVCTRDFRELVCFAGLHKFPVEGQDDHGSNESHGSTKTTGAEWSSMGIQNRAAKSAGKHEGVDSIRREFGHTHDIVTSTVHYASKIIDLADLIHL